MKFAIFLLIAFSFLNQAYAQRSRYKRVTTAYERVEILKRACLRKEYSNCYQLALIYLKMGENKDKLNRILSEHADDRVFELLEISEEEKLKKVKKAYVQNLKEKKDGPIISKRLRSQGMEYFGERILYLSCLNGENEACFSIANKCSETEAKRICGYRKKLCAESTQACAAIVSHEEGSNSDTIFWGALIAVGLAAFIISRSIFRDEEEFQAGEKLDESGNKKDGIEKHGIILKYSRPFFKRYVSPIVSGMKSKKKIKEKYRRPLASAGLTQVLTPEDFFSFKLFLILGFPILFILIRQFLEETWPLELVPVCGIVGFYYPDLWIKGTIKNRQVQVLRGMPFCVDMLALSVEAGLDFIAAMTKVIDKAQKSALTEEFEILLKEIKIGASRADALRNLSWRIDLIQVSSFTATLIAADSVGASVGPILKSLGNEIRQKRSSDAEKQGATAATKILIPMIFFIVPAVLCIIMGPVAVDYLANQ